MVSRGDWKRGRFGVGFETRAIADALRSWQSKYGDSLSYYRFLRELSQVDPVYDEGTGAGRAYLGPIDLPVLHVVHTPGDNGAGGTVGFYSSDTLQATVAFRQFTRTGLSFPDLRDERYLKDRCVYDGKVFRLTSIRALGQVQRADLILAIEALQVNADELADDAQFAAWGIDPDNDDTST